MSLFSTNGLPADQRAAAWSDIAGCDVARGEITPRNPAIFDGSLKRISLGRIVLSDIRCSAVQVRYVPDVAQMSHASYLVFMPLDSRIELSLDGRSGLFLENGELCLIDLERPHEFMQDEPARSLFVRIPKPDLERLQPRVANLVGQVMPSDLLGARTLRSFLRELLREVGRGNVAEPPHFFSQSTLNLLAGVFAARTDESADLRVTARALREYIDRNLTNSDLRQIDVANHFCVSDRYIRAMLHADGTSFSAYLLEQRLDLTQQYLRDPALRSASITEIAYLAGFNSAAHFGRMFREKFGVSPGQFRRRH